MSAFRGRFVGLSWLPVLPRAPGNDVHFPSPQHSTAPTVCVPRYLFSNRGSRHSCHADHKRPGSARSGTRNLVPRFGSNLTYVRVHRAYDHEFRHSLPGAIITVTFRSRLRRCGDLTGLGDQGPRRFGNGSRHGGMCFPGTWAQPLLHMHCTCILTADPTAQCSVAGGETRCVVWGGFSGVLFHAFPVLNAQSPSSSVSPFM